MKKYVIFFTILLALILIQNGCVSAAEIQNNCKINLTVSNDHGIRFNNGNDNYGFFYGSGDGTNSIKLTNDSSNLNPKVIFTNSQSGAFYIMNTGGKGFSDDGIIMLAINGTIPSNFKIHIQASGYQWIPTTGTAPNYSIISYNSSTLDEIFNQTDFIYGPQIWKPYYYTYPIFEGQDMNNATNTFNIMFIDLNAGILNPNNNKYVGQTLIDKGMIKIQYELTNLPLSSLAAFNVFAYAQAPGTNQPPGVEWTNAVNALGQTSSTTSGYYVNGIDTISPSVIADSLGGLFNTTKTIMLQTIDANSPATTYYTTDGSDPKFSSTRLIYTNPIQIFSTTLLRYIAVDPSNNWSPNYAQKYIIDTNKPTVIYVTPPNNSDKISINKIIQVRFSESVKIGSFWIELRSNGKIIKITKTLSGNTLTIHPKNLLLSGAKYTIVIHTNSIKDLANNKIALYTTNFFTLDNIAPRVIKSDPPRNSINIQINKTIRVLFSEKIKENSNWFELRNKGKNIKITYLIHGNTLTIKPKHILTKNAKYTIVIHTNSLRDLSDNNISLYTNNFTTKCDKIIY